MRKSLFVLMACLAPWACAQQTTCGDCNLDGVTSVVDGLLAAQFAVGGASDPNVSQESACDVNGSGFIDVIDALHICKQAAGVPTGVFSCPNVSTDWRLHSPESSPSPRASVGFAHDAARGVSVLFGGDDAQYAVLNDTWEWDGSEWEQKATTGPPGYGGFYAGQPLMAYDAGYQQVVLIDLTTGDLNGWSGSAWTVLTPTTLPIGYGSDAQLEYDSARGVLAMVTASSSGQNLAVWELSGSTWVEQPSAGGPTTTFGFATAYDSNRGVILVYGGQGGLAGYSNEMWEWDGNTWTQAQSNNAPAGGYWHDVTYDQGRQRVVLVGGWHCPTDGRSFLWDGASWTEVSQSSPVGTRERHSVTYDSTHGVSLLFGGHDWPGALLNDIWEF